MSRNTAIFLWRLYLIFVIGCITYFDTGFYASMSWILLSFAPVQAYFNYKEWTYWNPITPPEETP